MDVTPAERIQAVSGFLLQSPPGEINDILNDVRNIVSDDDLLQEGVLPALREYNLAQFTTVDVPGSSHQSIISDVAQLPSEEGQPARFLDPRSKTTFQFDHLTLEASDSQPYEANGEQEDFRAAVETSTLAYVAAHFYNGVASVFVKPESSNEYVIQLVGNKYNPANFWSGRWRSEYAIDLNEHKVSGRVLVNVHYYEQGNVQLESKHDVFFTLPQPIVTSPPNTAASKILALIEEEEGNYQISLNETYVEMREKAFKGLRRALPMTRQKLDWDKVLGYKLGAELSSSKNVFGNNPS